MSWNETARVRLVLRVVRIVGVRVVLQKIESWLALSKRSIEVAGIDSRSEACTFPVVAEEGSTFSEKSLAGRTKVGAVEEEDGIAYSGFRRTNQVEIRGHCCPKVLLQVRHTGSFHWGYFGEKDLCTNRVDRSIAREGRRLGSAVAAVVVGE